MEYVTPPTLCRLLIPAYNEAARITRCLESVKVSALPVGFEWVEWVVLDDDSTDGTADLVESWVADNPQISVKVLRATERRGKAAALGACHSDLIAQGLLDQLVIVLDADLAVVPDALASLLGGFSKDPNLGVVWGMDQIDTRRFGHWGSAYQMEAVMRLTRRVGLNQPRAYGRFFAYRVSALAKFCWQSGAMVDDTQLANFVHRHSVSGRTVVEARVLVTPAATSRDFHLQTQRGIIARTNSSIGVQESTLVKVVAGASTAARHPFWAVAYATARVMSGVRQRLQPMSFSDSWEPSVTTKRTIE